MAAVGGLEGVPVAAGAPRGAGAGAGVGASAPKSRKSRMGTLTLSLPWEKLRCVSLTAQQHGGVRVKGSGVGFRM